LLAPWHPWTTGERIEAAAPGRQADLGDVTVLIPARNEADVIGRTLAALRLQGTNLQVVLIDDQSEDATASVARESGLPGLTLVPGQPVPEGWSGKVWALHQGLARVERPLTLLLDADIELREGMLESLRGHMRADGRDMVSVMVRLRTEGWWEKLLVPAFIFFFKLLYPFALANLRKGPIAAAAGGCILVRTEVLRGIGSFDAIHDALIDDCALAAAVKRSGHAIWIGLTKSAHSLRPYRGLQPIWDMVARTAFTQLRYSPALLLLCTAVMLAAFWTPVAAPALGSPARIIALCGAAAMLAAYLPVLRFYGRSPLWALALPLTGTLYLLMTWSSALRYWRGRRSHWKGRIYSP